MPVVRGIKRLLGSSDGAKVSGVDVSIILSNGRLEDEIRDGPGINQGDSILTQVLALIQEQLSDHLGMGPIKVSLLQEQIQMLLENKGAQELTHLVKHSVDGGMLVTVDALLVEDQEVSPGVDVGETDQLGLVGVPGLVKVGFTSLGQDCAQLGCFLGTGPSQHIDHKLMLEEIARVLDGGLGG